MGLRGIGAKPKPKRKRRLIGETHDKLSSVSRFERDDKGARVVRQALITMPRKNGKTGLTAALALAHLCEAEERGQVYSAAADTRR